VGRGKYYRTELLTGVGQSFALIGLVEALFLQGVFNRWVVETSVDPDILCVLSYRQIVWRNRGAIYMGHFLADREKAALESLGSAVSSANWITDSNIHALTRDSLEVLRLPSAAARAANLIASRLRLQAYC